MTIQLFYTYQNLTPLMLDLRVDDLTMYADESLLPRFFWLAAVPSLCRVCSFSPYCCHSIVKNRTRSASVYARKLYQSSDQHDSLCSAGNDLSRYVQTAVAIILDHACRRNSTPWLYVVSILLLMVLSGAFAIYWFTTGSSIGVCVECPK